MRSKLTTALLCALAVTIAGGSYATAASLFTGKNVKNGSLSGADIKNRSITNSDIKNGTLRLNKLSKGTQALIKKVGAPGKNGTNGTNGTVGGAGDTFSPSWGIIHRNVVKGPGITLGAGPVVGTAANQKPPLGDGSLNFLVADGTEKAAFGNQTEFRGDKISGLTAVGFSVFQTGENNDTANNMPGITFEVDPSGLASNTAPTTPDYTSLVFQPASTPSNVWTTIDATVPAAGKWGLTGSFYNSPATVANCGLNGPGCTFAQVKAVLGASAEISFSAGVTKGRDNAWQGAIDAFRINGAVFDFEAGGVRGALL